MPNQNKMQGLANTAIAKSADIANANKKATTLAVVKSFIEKDDMKKRFQDILGKKAGQFLASITSLISSSTSYNDVDPNTVMSSAIVAATLDLPINPNLGFAYIIPYNSKEGKRAQFQMGYKGFIQLGLRSGQFKNINATEIYDGEIVGLNRLTGEITLDEEKKKSQKVIGYAAYFRLINGFEKTLYMSVPQLLDHGKRFSKSFDNQSGLWKKDFHSMAMKTVLKLLLSKYGILSVDMQKAIEVDQAVIKEDSSVEYVDSTDTTNEIADKPVEEKTTSNLSFDIAEKSKKHKEDYFLIIENAKNISAITVIQKAIVALFTDGNLIEADYQDLLTECNEKEKSFEG